MYEIFSKKDLVFLFFICHREEAKDAYFQAVMKAYLDCKEAAKQTYGRKKDN